MELTQADKNTLEAINIREITAQVLVLREAEIHQLQAASEAHGQWSEVSRKAERTAAQIKFLKRRLETEL